jgi:DNA replication protein DnaC
MIRRLGNAHQPTKPTNMEPIKNILPKAVADLEQPTKAPIASTEISERFAPFRTLNDPQLEAMKTAAVAFATDMLNGASPRWLTLLGGSGVGKTMLARIIWRLFDEKMRLQINWRGSSHARIVRWRGGFINWGEAVGTRMMKGDFEFLSDLRAWDFFVLDDIIAEYEKHTGLSSSKLYDVFEHRLLKWTVVTANRTLEGIAAYLDPRLASRMLRNGGVVIDVDVPDYNTRQ